MPNKCSAPNCFSNYYPDDPYIPVFKLPNKPPELRQEWITALRRVNMTDFKFIFVCAKHFREDDIEHVFKMPNPDGSFSEISRAQPKLRTGAVPSILPGCSSYYSKPLAPIHRLSFEEKEYDHFTRAIQLSCISQKEEEEVYRVTTLQEL